jgi:hypothetical protein
VVAFASDPAPPGVAAPLASEPLPFLPGGAPLSASLPDWVVLSFASSLFCASARLETSMIITGARILAFIILRKDNTGPARLIPIDRESFLAFSGLCAGAAFGSNYSERRSLAMKGDASRAG